MTASRRRQPAYLSAAPGRLLVTLGMLAACFIAGSDLPDPSWGGFYDAADEDGLLGLIWNHANGAMTATLRAPVVALVPQPVVATARSWPVPPIASSESRAPPLS